MVAWSASASGPRRFLALDHAGIIAELDHSAAAMPGPGKARYVFDTLGELYAVMNRVYALGVSLPDAPLREFELRVAELPRTTEAERLVVQRIGQDIFRSRLMDYWQGRCPLTDITEPDLLRASHIKPWAKCDTDAERLNVHNGLLLSALWDAAFDKGLVTFEDDGAPLFAPFVGTEARVALCWTVPVPFADQHRTQLSWHRKNLICE
jgi:hypothetical protein